MKTCRTCHFEKSLHNYYQTSKGYYFGECKKCHIHRVESKRDKEQRRIYMKKYGLRPEVKVKKKIYKKKWLKTEIGREWNKKRCRLRHHSDREYHNLKRAARAAGAEVLVLLIVKERDKVCKMCGMSENIQFDHVFPQSLGGLGTEDNLQLLCGDCNLFKSDNLLLPGGGMMIPSQDLKEWLVGEGAD